MPSYKHRDNAGALFKNKRKEQENHPDYKGEMNVGGKMFWLNAWLNTSRTGEKYLAIRLSVKEQQQDKPALKIVSNTGRDFDDDVGF